MSEALPVVLPGQTARTMTDHVAGIALGEERSYLWWWMAFLPSLGLLGLGIVATVWLFSTGFGFSAIDWPNVWGFPIFVYVWWIAIASGGTFISALFFLMRVDWRTSINRIAETMTLFSAACAGIYPDPASRPAMVFLLAVPLSEYHGPMAAISQSAAVGFLRGPGLYRGLACCSGISGCCPTSRPCGTARATRFKQVCLRRRGAGFSWLGNRMDALPCGLRHHGGDHGADGVLSA